MKKVFPGDKIQANDYNDIIDAVQKNDHSSEALFKISKPREVYVKNNTDHRILAGEPLNITSALYYNEPPEKAMHRFVSGGAALACSIQQHTPVAAIRTAFALETINIGKLGRCSFPGLVGGYVYFTDDITTPKQHIASRNTRHRLEFSDETASPDFFNVAAVYDSQENPRTRAFCFMVPNYNTLHYIRVYGINGPFYADMLEPFKHIRIKPGEVDTTASIECPNWTLSGATNPVVNVTCDSNGNLVVDHQEINIIAEF